MYFASFRRLRRPVALLVVLALLGSTLSGCLTLYSPQPLPEIQLAQIPQVNVLNVRFVGFFPEGRIDLYTQKLKRGIIETLEATGRFGEVREVWGDEVEGDFLLVRMWPPGQSQDRNGGLQLLGAMLAPILIAVPFYFTEVAPVEFIWARGGDLQVAYHTNLEYVWFSFGLLIPIWFLVEASSDDRWYMGQEVTSKFLSEAMGQWETGLVWQVEREEENPAPPTEGDGFEQLVDAVTENHPLVVERLLRGGLDVNQTVNRRTGLRTEENSTLLHIAVSQPNYNPYLVRLLLDAGATLQPDKNGFSPLYYAGRRGHGLAVEWFLETGVSLEQINKEGVFFYATQGNQFGLAQRLLDMGVDINHVPGYATALEALLRKARTVQGEEKLRYLEMAEWLLENGASTEVWWGSLLELTNNGSMAPFQELLLRYGATE